MAVGTPNAPRAAGAVRAWEVANEEAKAEAGDEGPRCQAGACHAQERDGRGGADVRGRVRAGIAARHEEVVSCVECDFDVCDACGGR
jgi:hypothetical protein